MQSRAKKQKVYCKPSYPHRVVGRSRYSLGAVGEPAGLGSGAGMHGVPTHYIARSCRTLAGRG